MTLSLRKILLKNMTPILNIAFILTGLLPLALSSFSGDIYAHDPSFVHSGKCYYIFSSFWAVDGNLHNGNIPIHRLCNDKSEKIGALFENIPKWMQSFTKVAPGMWAPDVNFFNNQFYVYFVGSSGGSRNSVIALATAKNAEGPYTDQGEV